MWRLQERSDPALDLVADDPFQHGDGLVGIIEARNSRECLTAILLGVFWKAHNPTTLNRQGADEGTQYRSIILTHDATQTLAAEKSKKEAQSRFSSPIVTEITALSQFFAAEDYHQDYFRKNPSKAYCRAVIQPKVDKFKKEKAGAAH